MKDTSKTSKTKFDREKYIPFAKISKKLMLNPKFRAAQKELEQEFKIMDKIIRQNIGKNS